MLMSFDSPVLSNQAQVSRHFCLLWFDIFDVIHLVALLCCRIAQQGVVCQSLDCRLSFSFQVAPR